MFVLSGTRYLKGMLFFVSGLLVFVNEAGIAKRILKDENFEGKFPQESWESLIYGKPNLGILHSFGSTTKEIRSRTIHALRNYGYGKSTFNLLLTSLVDRVFQKFEKERIENTGIISIDKYTFLPEMADMMWNFLIGSPFPGNKAEFESIVDAAEVSLNTSVKQLVILFAYKHLRFIPRLTMYQNTEEFFKKSENIIRKVISERRKAGKYKEKQTCFLDSFLLEIDTHCHPDITEEQLVWIVMDLHLVGVTGLPANSLQWAILFLSLNPPVLEKVVQEIDNVVGHLRQPSLEDRFRMPYTESVILESIRMGNIVNYATRSNLNDTIFDGYFIPKNTLVMVDTECLRKDPNVWTDPTTFRPDRFYDQSSNTLVNVEKLNAVGFKRPCLGEQITKQSNFILLTSFLQMYDIKSCTKFPSPAVSTRPGIIGRPEAFHIQLTPRNSTENGNNKKQVELEG